MKLIRCKNCEDVVRLINSKWRKCDCGKSGGQYNDDFISATVGGNCEVIGLRNDFFSGPKKDRNKVNTIIEGEYMGDNQIHRIKSPDGPKLKIEIEEVDDTTNKITFIDDRTYKINLKGNKSPKSLHIPSNVKPSFKDKKMRNENRIVRLTESQLLNIIKKVVNEEKYSIY